MKIAAQIAMLYHHASGRWNMTSVQILLFLKKNKKVDYFIDSVVQMLTVMSSLFLRILLMDGHRMEKL